MLYLEAARTAPGVSANPDGEACYRASIRYHTSLPMEPQEILEIVQDFDDDYQDFTDQA